MQSRIDIGYTKIIALAAVAAAMLLPSNARPEDRRPESKHTQREEMSADEGVSAADTQGSNQDSRQPEQAAKRSLFRRWLDMAEKAQVTQPDWLSPLATTSGRLKNELRYDVWDQPFAGGNRTFQFGGNKGLEFITSSRTQVLVGVPTYTLHSPNGPPGGFGDLPLMLKFRIASAQQRAGNYVLTFILAATAPTGSHRYGAGDAVLSPTLAFGKGWGRFDAQTTFGVNLPAGDTTKPGRQLQWNTAFQCLAAWRLWPELEVNATFYETGENAGKKQVFLTPGLGWGRAHVGSRLRFSSAVGMQTATTRFHTYNHRWMYSLRLSF